MSAAVTRRLPNKLRNPYISNLKRAKALTIAIGLECNEGYVLAADRLITHGRPSDFGSFAHYEKKVFGTEGGTYGAAVCGAGDANLIRPIAESFLKTLSEQSDYEFTGEVQAI